MKSIRLSDHVIHLLEGVVSYSTEHVYEGGIPFAAFVVDANGVILGRGVNRVLEKHDPTAHAEVEAIRDACRSAGTYWFRDATLLASGEPCAMCYVNVFYSGITRVIYAVDRDEAAKAGFDYRDSYAMLAGFPHGWPMTIHKHATAQALEPFNLWWMKRSSR